jgi:3-hydroxybutyryl-CoA dehydrogenase
MRMERIGVIGAGVMGAGVAQNLAQTGHSVVLLDTLDAALTKAAGEIARNVRFHGMLSGRRGGPGADEVLSRVSFTTDYAALGDVDFVIENVTEKWEVKRDVYPTLDAVCPPHCCIAANTSAIPITRLASLTGRAERVLGIHFMNPVPLKPTVEVIRGFHTSPETLETARRLLGAMGKEGIVVNDMPGFVSNRVLMLTINEAIWLLQDQVAPAEDVDRIFKTCFGHPMGPLETADLIGLDTILYSVEVLYEAYQDSKYRACPLLKKMVDAGLHGRKSGRGFYDYGGAGPAATQEENRWTAAT